MLEFYDHLFRYWAVGLFVLIGIFSLREYGPKLSASLAALSSFAAACYLLGNNGPGFLVFGWIAPILFFLSALGPIFIWLFSLSQFEDNFRLRKVHFGVTGLYVVLFVLEISYYLGSNQITNPAIASPLMSVLRFSILAHMVFVAWQGRADDLLERRRKFRTFYIILVTAFTGTITVFETWFRNLDNVDELLLFQAVAFMLLGMALAWHIMKFEHGVILVSCCQNGAESSPKAEPSDPADKHDLRQVMDLVVGEKIYLEAGLTISSLAEKVGLPEHRLRRLVNQHMGYRNFADFINHYRIDAAKTLLRELGNRNLQILVIAMDLGYGSLGPFNRAFKERTGLTPSEYRKKALAEIE